MRKTPALATLAFLSTFLLPSTKAQDFDRTVDLPVGPVTLESKLKNSPLPIGETSESTPPTFYGSEIKSKNNTIYYVLDVSGSMGLGVANFTNEKGDTITYGRRIDKARAELIKSIRNLPPNIKFNALAYDCAIYSCFGEQNLEPATEMSKTKAIAWSYKLEPNGGTATAPGVGVALTVKENKLVILLTDGAPCCLDSGWTKNGEPDAHRTIIRMLNTQRASINVYGIDAVDEFRKFCVDVASDNGGTYTDVK